MLRCIDMINRPSLDNIPNDQEYLDEIKKITESTQNMRKRLSWAFYLSIALYLIIGFYFEMPTHLMWIIGFPLFFIIYLLRYILVFVSNWSMENGKMSEYYIRHSLHRSEKINESIDKLNENSKL